VVLYSSSYSGEDFASMKNRTEVYRFSPLHRAMSRGVSRGKRTKICQGEEIALEFSYLVMQYQLLTGNWHFMPDTNLSTSEIIIQTSSFLISLRSLLVEKVPRNP